MSKDLHKAIGARGQKVVLGQSAMGRVRHRNPSRDLQESDNSSVPEMVHAVLRAPGRSLEPAIRGVMESRFGHDFGRVRVHEDSRAAESARSVNALAYTSGRHIVFGAGQYSPERVAGKLLIAHELAHVVQQENVIEESPKSVPGSLDPAEFEAQRLAIAATAGRRVRVNGKLGSPALQLSQLSMAAQKNFSSAGKGSVFDLLRANCPLSVADPDLQKWLRDNLKGDDLWLAQTIVEKGPEPQWDAVAFDERFRRSSANGWLPEPGHIEGKIGESSGLLSTKVPIKAFYFPGETESRALIIGGVHGSELSGIEVANRLVESLKRRFDVTGKMPRWTTIIVPELIPETAAQARTKPSTIKRDSNFGREIVLPLRGRKKQAIPPARQFPPPGKSLEDLLTAGGPTDEKGTRLQPVEPGTDPPKPIKKAPPVPLLSETVALLKLIERFRPTRIASVHAHRFKGAATREEDAPGVFVDPRGGLDKKRIPRTAEGKTDDTLALAIAKEAEKGGARVPGNWLRSAKPQVHYLASAGHPQGFSLGDWGPEDISGSGSSDRSGMTVITVEVEHYYESGQDPSGSRAKELQAHSDALQKILLESP